MSIAGAYTGFLQSPARQVFERVKSVMQIKEREGKKSYYRWSGECAVDLIRKEGIIAGLFRGFSSTVLREVPQFAIYYPSYEFFKRNVYSTYTSKETLVQFLAGGTAGIIQWLPPIYCCDVIKSRMQTATKNQYKGILDCILQIYREYGANYFFRLPLSTE